MKFRKDDIVQIETGRLHGQTGRVIAIDGERVILQIDGLRFERSYLANQVKLRQKAALKGGEARRSQNSALVREGKLCPSFPYGCSGTCGVTP